MADPFNLSSCNLSQWNPAPRQNQTMPAFKIPESAATLASSRLGELTEPRAGSRALLRPCSRARARAAPRPCPAARSPTPRAPLPSARAAAAALARPRGARARSSSGPCAACAPSTSQLPGQAPTLRSNPQYNTSVLRQYWQWWSMTGSHHDQRSRSGASKWVEIDGVCFGLCMKGAREVCLRRIASTSTAARSLFINPSIAELSSYATHANSVSIVCT
eukprot:3527677-Rhodomonas_salina.6